MGQSRGSTKFLEGILLPSVDGDLVAELSHAVDEATEELRNRRRTEDQTRDDHAEDEHSDIAPHTTHLLAQVWCPSSVRT